MQTSSPPSWRWRDYSNLPFEVFIAVFTIVPFLVLSYFYPAVPERVPLFLNLRGDVETWAEKRPCYQFSESRWVACQRRFIVPPKAMLMR